VVADLKIVELQTRLDAVNPKTLPDTDVANAKRLVARHGESMRYTPSRGWFHWDGKRWAADEKGVKVQALAVDTAVSIFDEIRDSFDRDAMMSHAKRSQSRKSIEAMVVLARSEPGVAVDLTDFDSDPWLFNVNNGTLDLRTGELREHSREDLISKLSPVAYDPDAEFELWDAFLTRVCGGQDDLYSYLRRLVGYLLTGKTVEQVLHFLFGLGANGKSVFCEIMAQLLGDYAQIAAPELVMARRHGGIPNDIARLYGARVAFMNETSQGSRFDEAKLKDLTGGDSLTGRFLHAEFFDFVPTHKLVIRGNHKPTISGNDEGIWRRLRLVPFTVQIPADEQDRHLIEKLSGELPGILRWAVQGCREWQQDGLNPPAVITDAVKAYREESDVLGRFIDEYCEVSKLGQVKSSVFFQRYQQFAEQAGERWAPSKDLPAEMQRRGFIWKRTNQSSMYLGIELRNEIGANWSGE
jgi:putative DNA primase/helicase